MRVLRTSGAIKLTATTQSEVEGLRKMVGKTFKASYTTPHSKHAGTRSDGLMDLWLNDVKEEVG